MIGIAEEKASVFAFWDTQMFFFYSPAEKHVVEKTLQIERFTISTLFVFIEPVHQRHTVTG